MNFTKDREELYDQTNKHFKDRARKECMWERLASSHKVSVKVCKTWLESHGIQDKFNFVKTHITCKGLSKSSGFKSPARGVNASTTS